MWTFIPGNIYHWKYLLLEIFITVNIYYRRVIGTSILVSRTREVLFDFSMDCDDNGKLILKPRQAAVETVLESKWKNSRLKLAKAASNNQNYKL